MARSCKPYCLKKKVRPAGLEPATPCLEGRCSIRLSYGRKKEGKSKKAKVIAVHFFLPTFAFGLSGRGDWIRTNDLSVPNRAHYQAVLRPDKQTNSR